MISKHKKETSPSTVVPSPVEARKHIVLVGTYRGDQLDVWPEYYNYPLSAKDKFDVECAKKDLYGSRNRVCCIN